MNLTPDQKKALLQLLARVDLKGAEVPVYVDILNAINKEEKVEKKKG